MEPYCRCWTWEDEFAGVTTALVLTIVIIALAVAITIIVATLAEIAQVYRSHAFQLTTAARVLWISLAALVLLWLTVGLLASAVPALAMSAAYVAAWSFFAYVVVVEAVDWHEQGREHEQVVAESL